MKRKITINSLVSSPRPEEPVKLVSYLSRWETIHLGWIQARSRKSAWAGIRYSMLARKITIRHGGDISPKHDTLAFNAFQRILEVR